MSTNGNDNSIAADLALAEHLLAKGMAEEAEVVVERLEKAAAAAAQVADDEDDGDDDEMLDEEDDDGDESDEEDGVSKSLPRYPHDDLEPVWSDHQNMQPMRTSTHATQDPLYSRFEARVREVAARDGLQTNMVLARQRARQEFGADFIASQREPIAKLGLPKSPPLYPESDDQHLMLDSGRKKKKTHMRPARHHDQQVHKTYEDAVAAELQKGCSQIVAETRVTERFGQTLPHATISKGEDAFAKFMAAVEATMVDYPHLTKNQAMSAVRKTNEEAFALMQELGAA
jgi:hypothetical protein